MSASALQREFRAEYGAHRAAEGRSMDAATMLQLPHLATGPFARQWRVRARTFEAFKRHVLAPMTLALGRPVRLLDLGAGNGWLAWRAAMDGHEGVAVDLRDDMVDGLGAGTVYAETAGARLARVVASFEALPLASEQFDLVVFNASLHYALDLRVALAEARRMTKVGGGIAVLDSPFYARDADGERMVEEKRGDAATQFGARARALTSLPFVEFLTGARLDDASRSLELSWRRIAVRYPLWYEVRPMVARLRGARAPSRFDLWHAVVS